MRREETASRARARRFERASTGTRAKSRTGTNARVVRDMPGRTWTRGDRANGGDGDGDDVEIGEIVRGVDDGRFEASRDVDERWVERGGRGRGGTRRDDETASRGRVGV